jgi:hypothetical protein
VLRTVKITDDYSKGKQNTIIEDFGDFLKLRCEMEDKTLKSPDAENPYDSRIVTRNSEDWSDMGWNFWIIKPN